MKPITPAQAKRSAVKLRGAFLFRGLELAQIEALISGPGVYTARVDSGGLLLPNAGEPRYLGVLLSGRAQVTKQSGSGRLYMSELAPGALFGMATLFPGDAPKPSPTRIQAVQSCRSLYILEDTLRTLMRADGRIMDNYIHYLTERIHFLNARIEGMTHPDAKSRVLLYLTQNAEDGRLTLDLTTLARALNISRATLYRALDALQSEGAIKRSGKVMEVPLALQKSDRGSLF